MIFAREADDNDATLMMSQPLRQHDAIATLL
jgi:hypothetical protein